MKRYLIPIFIVISLILTGCASNPSDTIEIQTEGNAAHDVIKLLNDESIAGANMDHIEEISEKSEVKEDFENPELSEMTAVSEEEQKFDIPGQPEIEETDAEEEISQEQSKTEVDNVIDNASVDTNYASNSEHSYYKGVPSEMAQLSDMIASDIAASIMNNAEFTTDLQRVTAASVVIKQFCDNDTYGMDTTKYYRSPYGVFLAGVYTCAGSTRALGRVLDYMGFSWQHTHENENRHQWCVLTMDGQVGYADGMSGIAGYGEMYNGMILEDGRVLYFAE